MTTVGTSHFVSQGAAVAYYRTYGETAESVARKLADGEIHIGPPTLAPGQHLTVIDGARRYAIEDIDPTPTYRNQLREARRMLAEKGRAALDNPHAMTGRGCGCGQCFCCAALQIIGEYNRRPYAEITAADVGRPAFRAFGRAWLAENFIGQILPGDVGKRVYQVGEVLQVENDEQRAQRIARY